MLLDTFFLRYRADTGQAVKDVNKLDATNEKMQKTQKKSAEVSKVTGKQIQEDLKKTGEAGKKIGEQFGQLSSTGGNAFAVLRGGASTLIEAVSAIGPAGFVAAAGIGAVIAAISIANSGIEDARKGAEEAIALGEKAFDARLAQGELIRLQNSGRNRGLSDEQTNQSAKGVYDRASEIRAAQRQAARDPASAFNNPLIKQAALWKKAGVDVSAAMEVQVEQQNNYLRRLQERNEGERALVEGTQLFGRTLADVKSVVSATQAEINGTALALATENELRRSLQTKSEALATSENKLESERKKSDERIRNQTVPATKDFTDALTEWTRATQPLQESWGKFVSSLIEGMAKVVGWSTKFINAIGLGADQPDSPEKRKADTKAELDQLEAQMRHTFRIKFAPAGHPATPEMRAQLETDIAAARKVREAELTGQYTSKDTARSEAAPANIKQAAAEMGVSASAEVVAAVEEAIKNDPAIDSLDKIKIILADQLAKQKEMGKVAEAQTAYTKKIEANTAALINTGLEQAMALWAANVGKASGLGTGGFQGETRQSYEQRMRFLQRTVNPNTARQVSEARATVGAFSSQADTLNKSAPANNGNSGGKSITIGDLKVEVNSQAHNVAGLAQDVGHGIRDELKYAVNEFADPRVS